MVERRLRLARFDLSRPVHCGWDASTRYDSTALAVVQAGADADDPVRVSARIWERPRDDDGRLAEDWLLPIDHVVAHIQALARVARVAAIQFDPRLRHLDGCRSGGAGAAPAGDAADAGGAWGRPARPSMRPS